MTLVIPENYALCAWQFALTGDPEIMVTTCGVDNVGPAAGQAAADNLADDFTQAFDAASILVGYRYLGVKLYVGQAPGLPILFEAPRDVAGTNAGPALPQNVAMLIRKTSAIAGRRGRGRMYLPPMVLGEDSISPVGVIGSAQMAVIQPKITAWLDSESPKVILHSDVPAPMAPTPITSFILDSMVATQRRRLRR